MTQPTTFTAMNATTARLAANLLREGRVVLVDPVEPFEGITGFIDLGLFPEDAVIVASSDVTRDPIRALNPDGGTPIVVDEEITDVNVTYELPCLTPDANVLALHAGAPSAELTEPDLAGVRMAAFNPGASVLTRVIVIAKRPGVDPNREIRVFWHQRAALQSNGTDRQGTRDVPQFLVTVRAFTYELGPEFAGFEANITPYGAVFTLPLSKLNALLLALDGEALPEPATP